MVLTAATPETKPMIDVATTTKIILILEYDGTHYYGFQWQAGLPTIQGEVEKAIKKLTRERVRVIAASRTDTGVHARGQVISFRTRSNYSPETFVNALNHYLPEDIAVKAGHRVEDTFNVRGNAISREYNYYILNSPTRSPLREKFAYLVSGNLDIGAMNQACQTLVGEPDLASFTSGLEPGFKNTVRRVYRAEVRQEGELVTFDIVANAFLPHQVRNTVGSLIRVGLGKLSLAEFLSIMEAKKPGSAGPTASACGLCLRQVNYPHPFEEER